MRERLSGLYSQQLSDQTTNKLAFIDPKHANGLHTLQSQTRAAAD